VASSVIGHGVGVEIEIVHSSFIFITEKQEGLEGPRRVAVLEHQDLTETIIGMAIEVHRRTGPGLLESVYAACMCFELERAGIPLLRQVTIPVVYKGFKIPLGFRADILVAETVILEIKAVPAFVPAHEAQLQTYLRMTGIPVGLLLNFHAIRLKDGLRRFVG
jgi:GxxExxY protein